MARVPFCALLLATGMISGCATPASVASRPESQHVPAADDAFESTATIANLQKQAREAEQTGDAATALKRYKRILQIDSGHPDAHHHMAVVADQAGRFDEAGAHYRAALARAPQDSDIRTSLGWSFLLQDRDADAERELKTVLQTDPKHQIALYNLGWLYAKRGDDEQALAMFRRGGSEADAQKTLFEIREQRANVDVAMDSPPTETKSISAPSPRRGRRGDLGKAIAVREKSQPVAALRPTPERSPRATIEEIVAGVESVRDPVDESAIPRRSTPERDTRVTQTGDSDGTPASDRDSRHIKVPNPGTRKNSETDRVVLAGHIAESPGDRSDEPVKNAANPWGLTPAEITAVGRAVILGKPADAGVAKVEEPTTEAKSPVTTEVADLECIEAAKIGLNVGLPPAMQVTDGAPRESPRRLKLTGRGPRRPS